MNKPMQINIRLSIQEKETLIKLAELKNMNTSALIREWIRLYSKAWLEPKDN